MSGEVRVTVERFDDGVCCECGEPTHTCADCPTFGGPGVTPGFPGVSGLLFIDVEEGRFVQQETTPDDDDASYLCDGCGRIGNADDGISGDGDDCPDEECGGTVHRIKEES